MKRLAILGASGHGKCLADVALWLGYTDILFFDDVWPNKTLNGAWSVVGSMQDLLESLHDFDSVIVGIGNNTIRMRKQASLLAVNAPLTTLPHPASTLSSFARYGAGSVFLAGTVVNVDTVLGDAVIVNTGATIDHDCLLASECILLLVPPFRRGTCWSKKLDWHWCLCETGICIGDRVVLVLVGCFRTFQIV